MSTVCAETSEDKVLGSLRFLPACFLLYRDKLLEKDKKTSASETERTVDLDNGGIIQMQQEVIKSKYIVDCQDKVLIGAWYPLKHIKTTLFFAPITREYLVPAARNSSLYMLESFSS